MAFGNIQPSKNVCLQKIIGNLKTLNILRLFVADHKTNYLNEHLTPHGYYSEKGGRGYEGHILNSKEGRVYLHLKNLCHTNPTSNKGTWTIESDLRQFLITKISFDYYF